jgi:hypothetical protein
MRPVIFDVKPGASYAVIYDRAAPDGSKLWIQDREALQPVKPLDPSARA